MRKGFNATRHQPLKDSVTQHRVIIPLYIPHERDYYLDAYKIFELCVKSIKRASTAATPITVVANGCSQEVHKKLLHLVSNDCINELIVETEQIGKVNSIRKAILASEEEFLTITDGDVLFLKDWDASVAQVFNAFPQATAVAPVPIHKTFNQFVSNIWFDYLFSNNIAFAKTKNPAALERFVQSIGWPYLNEHQKLEILTLKAKNGTEAVVGCSHFCTTYRRDVFQFAPLKSTKFTLGGDSEKMYLDLPTIQANGYRLSTAHNHAFHLGNKFEPWMQEEFDRIQEQDKRIVNWPTMKTLKKSIFRFYLKNRLFKKLLSYPQVYNAYLNKCGIRKEWAHKYYK